jgi:hypothetical protein
MKIKKAEITTGMMVGIIIVVFTFALLVMIYSQLSWSGDIDREVCKTSAIMRGTLDGEKYGSLVGTKDIISLKCKTKKICVTTNILKKGECETTFGTTDGKYSTYRISNSDKVKAEQQIKTLLAREMADCWDMLGRGNFPIFNREITTSSTVGAVAIICSRIHFDKTITGNENGQLGIEKISEFNRYLLTHKVPNSEMSYWDFLRNAYDGETLAILTRNENDPLSYSQFLKEELDISSTKAITFMEVRPSLAWALVGTAIGGTIGTIGGASLAGFPGLLTGGAGGSAIGFEVGDWLQGSSLTDDGLFPDGTSASGIFLTDYSLSGFQDKIPTIKGKKQSFQIASYA